LTVVAPPTVVLFTTGPGCSLCEVARAELERLATSWTFRTEVVDLRERQERILDYALRAPVVEIGGRVVAEGRIAPGALEAAIALSGARRRPAGGVLPG
jgi:hypothetical protein